MMSVPVMSLGIKSGVNWMRENLRSSTCAIVWMSSVLARPGTPTIRLLPPANSDSSTSSMTSSWPMMSLCSSEMIWSCPALSRSARAMSSDDSSAGAEIVVAKESSLYGWYRLLGATGEDCGVVLSCRAGSCQ